MSDMKLQTHLLFPTFVAAFECEQHAKFKSIFMDRLPNHCAIHESGGLFTGESSGHVAVHTDDALTEIFEYISCGIDAYLKKLCYDTSRVDINIVKTWISVTEKDLVTAVHLHATSHLSFVYYINMPKDADVIAFQIEKSPNEPYAGAFGVGEKRQKSFISEYNFLNSNQFLISSKEGTLLVFPSELLHGTKKIAEASSEQRIALAGDVLLVFNEKSPNYSTGLFSPSQWKTFPSKQ